MPPRHIGVLFCANNVGHESNIYELLPDLQPLFIPFRHALHALLLSSNLLSLLFVMDKNSTPHHTWLMPVSIPEEKGITARVSMLKE